MEHKHKLLATPKSQALGGRPESMIDRFSDLPDEVAHHILSFLNFDELVQVGSLSKRCRGLHLSTQSVKFYLYCWASKKYQLDALNSFDRFLIHRGDNKIKEFRIRLHNDSSLIDEFFHLITWVHIVTRCKVEVLDLEWQVYRPDKVVMEIPSCIFRCGSLRSLSVKCYAILQVPSFTGFINLQHLRLSSVTIDEGFCKWISSTCKCIKELHLDRVHTEKITIESSSLESFRCEHPYRDLCGYTDGDLCYLKISGEKLERIDIEWGFHEPRSRSLNIFAPNLKYFKWTGNLLSHQSLGNLNCLEKAEIIWRPNHLEDHQNGIANAVEFVSSIRRVKVLILSDKTTKALFKECSVSVPFDNISYLGIHVKSLSDELLPAMVSLLRGMSNLNTLCIESNISLLFFGRPRVTIFNRKYWKSQNLNFTSHLKEVKIELPNGYNGMELACYIVEQSQSLERMVLFHLPKQSYVRRKVTESKMASRSNASIVFRERQLINKYRASSVVS